MKFVRSTALILSVFCLPASTLAQSAMPVVDPSSIGFSDERLTQIGAWYQTQIDAGVLPGAVVAIARNGKLAYMHAIGHQDRDRKIPMRPDGIFWIASMTKPVTSVAAMILVEEGKLVLDTPVAQYLPDLKNMQVATEETDPASGEVRSQRPSLTQLIHPECNAALSLNNPRDICYLVRVVFYWSLLPWLTVWRLVGSCLDVLSRVSGHGAR